MTESPISLRDETGVERFRGTQSPGGGSQPGARRTLSFPFDFSMAAALAVGVPVWTPAVGDWLLGAWIETDDGWAAADVLTFADIGIVIGGAWADIGGGPTGIFTALGGAGVDLTGATWTADTQILSYLQGTMRTDLEQAILIAWAGTGAVPPKVKFRTTDPLSLVVSSDATPTGTPTDASAGASTLFIEVCTPAAA